MDLENKLRILAAAAKYDVSCSSSGSTRSTPAGGVGNAASCGICHSYTADGRCVSLLKILLSNACAFDCAYCVNRRSNDVPRAAFTPEEAAELTMGFYRRNYIEGLFLSSAVSGTPDRTCELLLRTLSLLREKHRFGGYIHVKAIPGADPELIRRMGFLADRMSANIELPSAESLARLAPEKSRASVLTPMKLIRRTALEHSDLPAAYRGPAPKFVPAGQSTQLIVGATPESDLTILRLAEGLYRKFALKRVYYSAYVPVGNHPLLPGPDFQPPLLREHRLYQADWLLRFYGFRADELLSEKNPDFNLLLDPKCNWALNHPELFPVEVNRASYETLLRVPGIGVLSAGRIVKARRSGPLDFDGLKKLGVVLKRAGYFVTCKGKSLPGVRFDSAKIFTDLLSDKSALLYSQNQYEQLSLFGESRLITAEEVRKCLTGQP